MSSPQLEICRSGPSAESVRAAAWLDGFSVRSLRLQGGALTPHIVVESEKGFSGSSFLGNKRTGRKHLNMRTESLLDLRDSVICLVS